MSDPWTDLPPAGSPVELSARRVSEGHAANFFWARDGVGRVLLLLQHTCEFPAEVRLPKLTGVKVERQQVDSGTRHLRFVLENAELRDIFAELCSDIVGVTDGSPSEASVIRAAVSRTWRWHHLLRGGGSRLLSEERQKGLIGELLALKSLAGRMGYGTAVDAWKGPFGGPKDFLLPGSCALESKATRGTEAPFIQISSEWQLDSEQLEAVFLCVATVTRGVAADPEATTLSDIVARIRDDLTETSPGVLYEYETALYAAGFSPEDDYTEYWWTVGDLKFYEVQADFPRIQVSGLPPGVSKVTYRVDLPSCGAFAVDRDAFFNSITTDEPN